MLVRDQAFVFICVRGLGLKVNYCMGPGTFPQLPKT